RQGAIVTVERLVKSHEIPEYRDAVQLPNERVLAVCQAPFGAHPQPFYALERFDTPSYRDDFEHYALWRELSRDRTRLAGFVNDVLCGQSGAEAYRAWLTDERLARLRTTGKKTALPAQSKIEEGEATPGRQANVVMIVAAARKIAERVRKMKHETIL